MIPCKILVVEDDPHISELIKITVSSPVYSITCVDTGGEALAKLLQDKPNLVLLDILVPEPDGWSLYKTIRNNPGLAHTRVIILSALPIKPEVLTEKNLLPTDMFMAKPFDLDDLRMNVKNMLTGG
jgi:two-component system alkaline phosphatase synthesis response regulator PhoP